jgi:uncharacterized membrane protein required for colicin V production
MNEIIEDEKYRRKNDRMLQAGAIIGIIVGFIGIVSSICAIFVAVYITPLNGKVLNHVDKFEPLTQSLEIRLTVLESRFLQIQDTLIEIKKLLREKNV